MLIIIRIVTIINVNFFNKYLLIQHIMEAKYFKTEHVNNDLVITWRNKTKSIFKKEEKKYKAKISVCDKKSLLVNHNNILYHVSDKENRKLIYNIDDCYSVTYNKIYNKLIVVLDGPSSDFVYMFKLNKLRRKPVDIEKVEYVDSYTWNSHYCMNDYYMFCLHDDGIYAFGIGSETIIGKSNLIKVKTEFDYEEEEDELDHSFLIQSQPNKEENVIKYQTDDIMVDDKNVITHYLKDEDSGKTKIEKIKFDTNSKTFKKLK